MARFISGDCEKYIEMLEKLQGDTESVIAQAVYAGAGAVADEFRNAIGSLSFEYLVTENGKTVDAGPELKQGMERGLVIYKHQKEDGVRSTRCGIAGTSKYTTRMYPGGIPYSFAAHSVNTGTSNRPAQPWIAKATRTATPKAEKAMQDTVEKEIEKIMK